MTRIIKLANPTPKFYETGKMGDEPVLSAEQPELHTVTTITISDNSSLLQAVAEVMAVWSIHSHNEYPSIVLYSTEAQGLAQVLSGEFGNVQIKELV